MKAKASPLHIIDFAITEFEFALVGLSGIEEDVVTLFQNYEIDIDFGISSNDYLKVFIEAEINRGEDKLPGYSIIAKAACIFKLDEEAGLPDDIKQSLEGFSTIYIALNSLRGLISNFTANAPFGRYILPSIDLNDLIEKKKNSSMEKKKVNKKNTGASGKKRIKAK